MFFKRKDPTSSEAIGESLTAFVKKNAQQLMFREVYFKSIVIVLPFEAETRWKPYSEELRSALIERLQTKLGLDKDENYQPQIIFRTGMEKGLTFSGSFESQDIPDGW
ncbi:MAG: hypothetical protein CR997_00290 [Acidobacteria bacterium]|nr:MAG: hypothetical protein CR997_00290 [Acidobacteriota bacterium]